MPVNEQAQAFLDRLAALSLPPLETLSVEAQRQIFDARSDPDGPSPPHVASVRDLTFAGPAGEVPLRVYRLDEGEPLPVVVYAHGGGWVLGNLDSHDTLCRAIANTAGAIVISVDYRLAPEHVYPAAFDDCCAALMWVQQHASEFGGDPARIAVAGDSAGGNLAAAVALWARDHGGPRIAAQILTYPVTNLAEPDSASYADNAEGYLLTAAWMNWFNGQYVPDPADRYDPYVSPALATSHEGLPPAVILTAEYDPLCDDGWAYTEKLRSAGVLVHHHLYPGQVHGFANQIGTMDDAQDAADRIGGFLKARFRGA